VENPANLERGTEISDDEVGRIVERISEPSRELRL
jgi:hypothetical protein